MSIRDYDPLLKRAAKKNKPSAKQASATQLGGFGSRNATPIRIGVGARQWKASDVSSGAALGKALRPIFDDIAHDFRAYTRRVEDFIPQDLLSALGPTMDLSQIYVPKDTGELASSAYLEITPYRSGSRVEMGYGRNGEAPHAIYVHEVPFNHEEPTSWKFLERAINEDWANIVQRITSNMKIRLNL